MDKNKVERTMPSRISAQQQVDEIRIFQRELQRLERDGILKLGTEQHHAIKHHHDGLISGYVKVFDIDQDIRSKQLSLGMRIASFLGAIALAASVFFLFYQFWGNFSVSVQVSTLILSVLGSFLLTIWIQARDQTGYFSKLAAMVTFTCFVLNVVMLGQIFDITPSDKALLPWAALAMLLAYACDLRLLLSAGILCIIGFVAARVGTWSGMYWINFGERPENFFPVAIAMLLLPHFVRQNRYSKFDATYRVFGLLALYLPMLVLANVGTLSYLDIDRDVVEGTYQVLGFALSALAIWVGTREHWPDTINTGTIFFVIFLYTKLFDWWWDSMPKYLFFMVLGLTAILVLMVLKRMRGTTGKWHEIAAP